MYLFSFRHLRHSTSKRLCVCFKCLPAALRAFLSLENFGSWGAFDPTGHQNQLHQCNYNYSPHQMFQVTRRLVGFVWLQLWTGRERTEQIKNLSQSNSVLQLETWSGRRGDVGLSFSRAWQDSSTLFMTRINTRIVLLEYLLIFPMKIHRNFKFIRLEFGDGGLLWILIVILDWCSWIVASRNLN